MAPSRYRKANVTLNDVVGGDWHVSVRLFGADGVTPIDAGFQFVAVQAS